MILHSLDTLYDRLRNDPAYRVAPSGYSLQKVSFKVVLTPTGALLAIQDAREPSRGTLRPKQILVPGHAKSTGSGLNPCLLWDNSGYMLGYKADDKAPQRTRQSFSAFREKHVALEAEIGASAFSALCRFLESWDPASAPEHPVLADAARTGFGVFQIQGEARYVHDDPRVSAWWDAQREVQSGGERGHCLVSGQERRLARLHPKIKGIAGAQSAGAAIVSFNDDAYESYGKSQSYNAPVSKDVSVRYVTALNALLDGPMRSKHRFTLADTTVAFWTEQPTWTEDIFLPFVSEGSNPRLLHKARRHGRRLTLVAPPPARSTPRRRRCAAPPHRAPLDTSLLCSTKHARNARWTTQAVWFSTALRRIPTADLWSIFAPPFSIGRVP